METITFFLLIITALFALDYLFNAIGKGYSILSKNWSLSFGMGLGVWLCFSGYYSVGSVVVLAGLLGEVYRKLPRF